jgi:alpha-D-ribose 1-methylphosphonate 5-triphosphate synthase subunit PhnL
VAIVRINDLTQAAFTLHPQSAVTLRKSKAKSKNLWTRKCVITHGEEGARSPEENAIMT